MEVLLFLFSAFLCLAPVRAEDCVCTVSSSSISTYTPHCDVSMVGGSTKFTCHLDEFTVCTSCDQLCSQLEQAVKDKVSQWSDCSKGCDELPSSMSYATGCSAGPEGTDCEVTCSGDEKVCAWGAVNGLPLASLCELRCQQNQGDDVAWRQRDIPNFVVTDGASACTDSCSASFFDIVEHTKAPIDCEHPTSDGRIAQSNIFGQLQCRLVCEDGYAAHYGGNEPSTDAFYCGGPDTFRGTSKNTGASITTWALGPYDSTNASNWGCFPTTASPTSTTASPTTTTTASPTSGTGRTGSPTTIGDIPDPYPPQDIPEACNSREKYTCRCNTDPGNATSQCSWCTKNGVSTCVKDITNQGMCSTTGTCLGPNPQQYMPAGDVCSVRLCKDCSSECNACIASTCASGTLSVYQCSTQPFTLSYDCNPPDPNPAPNSGLGGGAIAAIVIGGVVVLGGIAAGMVVFMKRRGARADEALLGAADAGAYQPPPM